jgi:hypothetical protein
MKDTTNAVKAKQSIKVYENNQYSIYTIPLNYMITYKVKTPYKTKNGAIERLLIGHPQYSDLDRGLEYAKETAEYMIQKTRNELSL